MKLAVEDPKWRYDTERAVAQYLVDYASMRSIHIRQRLAAVAEELRYAAATAGSASDGLLELASKFEQHSQPGDGA